jgi:hypothetical protein
MLITLGGTGKNELEVDEECLGDAAVFSCSYQIWLLC